MNQATKLSTTVKRDGSVECRADRLAFVPVKSSVMLGSTHIATARSSTMARRIANALNLYIPNQKGY